MAELDKKYYKIKEVADILGLPASTLRFWEKKFTIIKPKRSESGRRYYTPADIERLRMVTYLVKEKGLHLEAAEEQIRHNHANISKRARAVERLREIRRTLVQLLEAANTRPGKRPGTDAPVDE
ncbi:MAG: MerR family transcriptional regulator [Bacteroidales bacterium]|nr:MerR family transcriptional regulator [Bacteroidales bacterium]